MNIAKHSPGEWEVIFDHDGDHGIWAGDVLIAVTAGDPGVPRDVDAANAKLMATAPQLIELAAKVLRYFGTGRIDPRLDADLKLRTMAMEALKKAGLL
jgi:hypothetical protein